MKVQGIKAFDIKADEIQDIEVKNDFLDYLNELLGLYKCLVMSMDDAFQTLYKIQDGIVEHGKIDENTLQNHNRQIKAVNFLRKKIVDFDNARNSQGVL